MVLAQESDAARRAGVAAVEVSSVEFDSLAAEAERMIYVVAGGRLPGQSPFGSAGEAARAVPVILSPTSVRSISARRSRARSTHSLSNSASTLPSSSRPGTKCEAGQACGEAEAHRRGLPL